MGDRIEPNAGPAAIVPPAPQPQGLQGQDLKRAADFLSDNVRIGNHRSHYDKYRRYVDLLSQQMFDNLVLLYDSVFKSQWQHFKRLLDAFDIPPGISAHNYAAKVYISTWFHDLYFTIREATRVISPLAYNESYTHDGVTYSTEYDAYLSLLNASLRPTHIQLTSEDVMFIPVMAEAYDWTGPESDLNPFGIQNFVLNHDIFYGLLQIMKDRKQWKMQQLSTHTMGRPCWLFDWHDNNQVCAWFTREANYNDTDVALAYIIGVACTPKLAPRDVDDWQFPPIGIQINVDNLSLLDRLIPRRFYGSYEVRTIAIDDNYTFPDTVTEAIEALNLGVTKKRKPSKGKAPATSKGTAVQISAPAGEPATSDTATTETLVPYFTRYRITDWCYYSRVILNIEWHTRTGAHRIICFG